MAEAFQALVPALYECRPTRLLLLLRKHDFASCADGARPFVALKHDRVQAGRLLQEVLDERPTAVCDGSHIWIDRLPTASAASFTASVRVGWAWQVRAMSSAAAPNSIATAASAIMLPASGPRMWTPRTRSVLASARIFTKPSVCRLTLARPLAVNGNLPAL